MAVAARVLFQVILVVFLRRIEIDQRTDLHHELLAAAPLDGGNPFHRLPGGFIGVIDSGLVLGAPVIPLPVFHRGVDDVEVGQQQGVQADLVRVIGHLHCFPEAGGSGADGAVVGIRFPGAVGVAAGGIQHAGDGLHQVFYPPKAAAGQINHMFGSIHGCHLLLGHARRLPCFLGCFGPVHRRRGVAGCGASAQQQGTGQQQGQCSFYQDGHLLFRFIQRKKSYAGPRRISQDPAHDLV